MIDKNYYLALSQYNNSFFWAQYTRLHLWYYYIGKYIHYLNSVHQNDFVQIKSFVKG